MVRAELLCLALLRHKLFFWQTRLEFVRAILWAASVNAIAVRIPSGDRHLTISQDCVCRVCVLYEFYAFYTLYAFKESVSYGFMEGLKVQVPPPAFYKRASR